MAAPSCFSVPCLFFSILQRLSLDPTLSAEQYAQPALSGDGPRHSGHVSVPSAILIRGWHRHLFDRCRVSALLSTLLAPKTTQGLARPCIGVPLCVAMWYLPPILHHPPWSLVFFFCRHLLSRWTSSLVFLHVPESQHLDTIRPLPFTGPSYDAPMCAPVRGPHPGPSAIFPAWRLHLVFRPFLRTRRCLQHSPSRLLAHCLSQGHHMTHQSVRQYEGLIQGHPPSFQHGGSILFSTTGWCSLHSPSIVLASCPFPRTLLRHHRVRQYAGLIHGHPPSFWHCPRWRRHVSKMAPPSFSRTLSFFSGFGVLLGPLSFVLELWRQ
jgi:hypothetical protein